VHELRLCESLVRCVETEARRLRGARIHRVHVAVGALSCASPEALAFCYGAVTRGTLAEGSELSIRRVAATGRCIACGAEGPMDSRASPCCECGSFGLVPLRGEELVLEELEIE
jgi:hydrogenase nickel incorporation protein HypA/HybF